MQPTIPFTAQGTTTIIPERPGLFKTSQSSKTPNLEHCLTLRANLLSSDKLDLGPIKGGPRRICSPVKDGSLTGTGPAKGLEATLLAGGSDWVLFDAATNASHIDVRLHARTNNGEGIYITYTGYLKMNDAILKLMSGDPTAKSTEIGDAEFFIAPVFEVGASAFKWMELTLWVGQGRLIKLDDGELAVEFEISRVTNN